jgi:hypothetical protein
MMKPYLVNSILIALLVLMMIIFWNIDSIKDNHAYNIAIIVVFGILLSFKKYSNALEVLKNAIKKEGLELVESKYKFNDAGPFRGKVSSSQAIFSIKVMDDSGKVASGWACVGTYLIVPSLATRKVKVFMPAFYKNVDFKTINL